MSSTYDKHPYVEVTSDPADCDLGWPAIVERLYGSRSKGARVICLECYPGVFEDEIVAALLGTFSPAEIFRTRECLRLPVEIDAMLARELSDDPVFGKLTSLELKDFFDAAALDRLRYNIRKAERAAVVGTGAALAVDNPELLVYADLARWEIQQRQRRRAIGNFATENLSVSAAEKYKRAFFVDWRVADSLKKLLLPTLDFLLDTNRPNEPKMISGGSFRQALAHTVTRPFRVQPFFDPGPWGGQWMRKVCDLPNDAPNYAWCFDCVPEENSLLLGFGDRRVEVPAIDLVFSHPRELLGEAVHARFGTEFPIRFDFLDTMEGGNLSLQVHPLTEYIAQHFGMTYTQDESYYLLDSGQDSCVYLGLKENLDRPAMVRALWTAQEGGPPFCADNYVNRWPAKKHDHFLIPAGTIHCSGSNSMVLEISATPYIFTFKLWDWGRLGLDGRPRPIHLERGIQNIQWDRTTAWVERELVNRVKEVARGDGWTEERTGLHEREFIETRRHWFTKTVPHDTDGGVNVLNLAEGDTALVESPQSNFDPFVVDYAETFIVPAQVGAYTIRPVGETSKPLGTIKAFVRTRA
ncbi:MAG: class I mannose-6-phosphate isomerase [Acidobacteriota bacterium]|nr:class I mannose-6-phosphate isomerase [Acidobacteriota bacterium]